MRRFSKFLLSLPAIFAAVAVELPAQTVNAGTPEYFENNIRPILANYCFGCHTNSQLGGLRLDTLEGMKKGGQHGPAIVAGDPANSLLIKAVRQTGDIKMPRAAKSRTARSRSWKPGLKPAPHGRPAARPRLSSPKTASM